MQGDRTGGAAKVAEDMLQPENNNNEQELNIDHIQGGTACQCNRNVFLGQQTLLDFCGSSIKSDQIEVE